MTSKNSEPASRGALNAFRERRDRHALICEGLLPGLAELFEGAPWFGGSMDRDIQAWCQSASSLSLWRRDEHGKGVQMPMPRQLKLAISLLRKTCQPMAVEAVRLHLEAIGHDDQWRMRAYQACQGNDLAAEQLAVHIAKETQYRDGFEGLWREAVISALLMSNSPSMAGYCNTGLRYIARNGEMYRDYKAANVQITQEQTAAAKAAEDARVAEEVAKVTQMMAALRGADPNDPEFQRAVAEGRAEAFGLGQPAAIVVPALPEKAGSSSKKEMIASWEGIAGQPLPLVRRGDVATHRRRLVDQWPHAADIIDAILGDLSASNVVRFRPTLLVGAPGNGKSSLARAICDTLGLPVELYSMGGMADASLGGTSAQWSTARESMPLQIIKRSKCASVGVIWDEIEKVGTGTHNGGALDALLPMLEIDQARHFRDLALEVEVDLSHVSHFATANSVANIPAPLRDRMRILHVPEPTWTHLGTLTRQVVDRIALERGIDPRWFSPLAEDEMDLVREAWPGGSIRKLTRIITTILDGRDQLMGRC